MTDVTTYYKIIGKNYGNYPYRLGLNTLKYNNETFDSTPDCTSRGLYYTTSDHILEYLGYGNTLCTVTIPDDAQVVQVLSKYKTDRLEITNMLPLSQSSTWKYLVQCGADIHAGNEYAVRWAARHGCLEIVKYLVSLGVDIHADGEYALHLAVGNGHLDIVKYLGSLGADIRINYALQCATANGHLDMVKYLVQCGADIHADDDCAVRWAAENGYLDVVKYLVQCGADIHACGNHALCIASVRGYLDVVEYIKTV